MSDEAEKLVVFIDSAEKDSALPEFDQDAPCPHCGGKTETGFGLAGGGFGIYAFCPACEMVTSKSEEPDE